MLATFPPLVLLPPILIGRQSTGENFFDKALANGVLEGGDVPYLSDID
jgi:hypothetical protein